MIRKRKQKESGLKGDEWLATYSDCVTLLLTFFVLLYSMSTVDAKKVQAISKAFSVMTGQSGDTILQYDHYNGTEPIIGGESKIENTVENSENAKQKMYQNVKKFIQENDMESFVDITEEKRGINLQLRDNILFESGQAILIPESREILDKINNLISNLPNSIMVEGHTDNVPISNSKYASNWELSTERAVNVVRYFIEKDKQNPARFSAAGYGEYKPIVENTSDYNKSKNRRVNILIVGDNKE